MDLTSPRPYSLLLVSVGVLAILFTLLTLFVLFTRIQTKHPYQRPHSSSTLSTGPYTPDAIMFDLDSMELDMEGKGKNAVGVDPIYRREKLGK
jgi:hypothetical protein